MVAKRQLLSDVDNLDLPIRPHRLPNRLDNPKRQAREVDDIIALLTFADEQKASDKLPIYIAASPKSIAYGRWRHQSSAGKNG